MHEEQERRMEALCEEFENLCHALRYHQKECVPTRPSLPSGRQPPHMKRNA